MSKMLVRVFNDDFSLSWQKLKIDDVNEYTTDTAESRLEGVTIIAIRLEKHLQCEKLLGLAREPQKSVETRNPTRA